ncbi:Uncharacterised protein [Salmonella enterica subsp. arizonae]|uniref:Uncharacterized protein n=1 Tax=Salmonella enterica subsp. arizonae TaxID=59203 RepID=A0A447R2W4_SALER|nr:Uncharacterised protein [Salmonella enterica subsp. arizonae]
MVAIASMKVLAFLLFIYSSYFKRHVRWLSSFPQPLNYVPPWDSPRRLPAT